MVSVKLKPGNASNVKCQAKNPATCRFHGHPEQTNRPTVADIIKKRLTVAKTTVTKEQLLNQALTSDLNYEGKLPTWWESFVTETSTAIADKNSKGVPDVEPKLLDVINIDGKPVAVVWCENSPDVIDVTSPNYNGIQVKICYLKDFETGSKIGYVKTSEVNDQVFEQGFGDDELQTVRWLNRYRGLSLDAQPNKFNHVGPTDTLTDDDWKEVWVCVYRHERRSFTSSSGEYINYYNLSKEHAPNDVKTVREDIAVLSKEKEKTIKGWRDYFSTPFIDYSNLQPEYQGKGYGTVLYTYAARQLGRNNQMMRASSLQSDEASNLWESFKRKLPADNITTLKLTYEREDVEFVALDFRMK